MQQELPRGLAGMVQAPNQQHQAFLRHPPPLPASFMVASAHQAQNLSLPGPMGPPPLQTLDVDEHAGVAEILLKYTY